MNINQITEKAVAERMGALMLENAKLQALLAAANAQVSAFQSRVAELEKGAAAQVEGENHDEPVAMAG